MYCDFCLKNPQDYKLKLERTKQKFDECNLRVHTFYIYNLDYLIRIHCLKYLRSTTLGCKDIGARKFEFVE